MNHGMRLAARRPSSVADTALRARFSEEQAQVTRAYAAPVGMVSMIVFMGWSVFDRILEPANADAFLAVRFLCAPLMMACIAVLWRVRLRPVVTEVTTLALIASVVLPIAWMIPRVEDSVEAYLLGYSLPVYASALLIGWHWRGSLFTTVLSVGALIGMSLGAPHPLDAHETLIAAFYLGALCSMSIAGAVVRHQFAWREFLAQAQLRAQRERNERLVTELARQSREDPLTGLANRRGLNEAFEAALGETRRSGRPLSLLVCDLDHFKAINDGFGHEAGDCALKSVAALLRSASGPGATVARIGGDELVVLAPGTSLGHAAELGRRLVDQVGELPPVASGAPELSLSIGVTSLGDTDSDLKHITARADRALYRAKTNRNTVDVEPPEPEVREPLTLSVR